MKKDEYLNRMAQELKQYDKQYVDEIIGDYEEHFREGMEMGKSEEDICAKLGDVTVLVEEIKEMMQEMTGVENQCEFQVGRPLNEELIEAERVYSEEGEACNAVTGLTGLKTINFSAGAADIRVLPSRDNRFYAYTEDSDDNKYLVQRRRGDAYYGCVKRESKPGSLGAQIKSTISSAFPGFIGEKTLEVLGSLEDILIDVGSITLEVPEGIEEILVNTTCGDLSVKNIKCKELRGNCASGDISVQNTEGEKILLITKSGDVKISQAKAEKLETKSMNGDLTVKDVKGKEISANSVNGDIHGSKLVTEMVSAKAVRGDIRLKLRCHEEPFYAYAKTTWGDIKVKNGHRVSESDLQRPELENRVKVTALTVSGDISVSAK